MPVRSRHRAATKDYELYFDRAMTEFEIMALLKSQKRFMPDILTEECSVEILDTILHQSVRRQSIWHHLGLFLRDTFLPVLSPV